MTGEHTKKRIRKALTFILAGILSLSAGCAGPSAGGQAGGGNAAVAAVDVPFTITVTDKNVIYVDVKKSFFDPVKATKSVEATFLKDDGKEGLFLTFTTGGTDFGRCEMGYGEHGDSSKTVASDYGRFEEKDGTVRYQILLNRQGVTMSGADNLTIPTPVFESLSTCKVLMADDSYKDYPAGEIIKYDIDRELEASRASGRDKLESELYKTAKDREFLTPKGDDFRVEIYEAKAKIYQKCSVTRPPNGALTFGTSLANEPVDKPCKIYRVISYAANGTITGYAEKAEFESEYDALHIYGANNHEENGYVFYYHTGKDVVPEDLKEDDTLKVICDEIMPGNLQKSYGIKLVREGNAYYSDFSSMLKDNPTDTVRMAYFGETYIYGNELHGQGMEFSADNADSEGYLKFERDDRKVTVYYSKPEAHAHNITRGGTTDGNASGATGELPKDFVAMDKDGQYFKPSGDDYILFFTRFKDYGDYKFNEYAVLVSFNDKGEMVNAALRRFRAGNVANPMSELVAGITVEPGTKLLYSDDSVAYIDVAASAWFKNEGRTFTKAELIKDCMSEDMIKMPLYGTSADVGMYISKQ
ncbi:MAG: hypothetical protein IK152_00410 [Lachnospiraceae bacterium]|nr:hypothetical protein [Lachnospiraceae bacterium]